MGFSCPICKQIFNERDGPPSTAGVGSTGGLGTSGNIVYKSKRRLWSSLFSRKRSLLEDPNSTDKPRDSDVVTATCGHLYHRRCIVDWCQNNSKCPICPKSVRRKELRKLNLEYPVMSSLENTDTDEKKPKDLTTLTVEQYHKLSEKIVNLETSRDLHQRVARGSGDLELRGPLCTFDRYKKSEGNATDLDVSDCQIYDSYKTTPSKKYRRLPSLNHCKEIQGIETYPESSDSDCVSCDSDSLSSYDEETTIENYTRLHNPTCNHRDVIGENASNVEARNLQEDDNDEAAVENYGRLQTLNQYQKIEENASNIEANDTQEAVVRPIEEASNLELSLEVNDNHDVSKGDLSLPPPAPVCSNILQVDDLESLENLGTESEVHNQGQTLLEGMDEQANISLSLAIQEPLYETVVTEERLDVSVESTPNTDCDTGRINKLLNECEELLAEVKQLCSDAGKPWLRVRNSGCDPSMLICYSKEKKTWQTLDKLCDLQRKIYSLQFLVDIRGRITSDIEVKIGNINEQLYELQEVVRVFKTSQNSQTTDEWIPICPLLISTDMSSAFSHIM